MARATVAFTHRYDRSGITNGEGLLCGPRTMEDMSEARRGSFAVPDDFKPRCRHCWARINSPTEVHPESQGVVVFHLACEPVVTPFRFVDPKTEAHTHDDEELPDDLTPFSVH